jgi:capsular polysaccharide transport system ATP-binding protein
MAMLHLRQLTKSDPTPRGKRYAFRDLDVTFPEGKSVGLIGGNGAGKSTLLRIIGGIDAADSGAVVTDARISWPVGLSHGFQGSLTGTDNVRFVCRCHGDSREDARAKVAFVRAFAQIGEYFDLPVKSYSSGMRARLAFGLSMAFDFDYYLIDEVMAVGDAAFRKKCHAVLRERLVSSNMILVSHSMRDIRNYCDVVLLLDPAGATLFDDVSEGIAAYQAMAVAA